VDGELEIYRKSVPICHDTPGIEAVQGFPDLALIVDSSGSMRWDPNAGTGPYDSLLRAVYSMLQFLEQKQKAYHMKFSVLNFSGMTLRSGWQPYSELRQIKEMLFRYQGGGTIFDGSSLESLIRESNDRFLAVMVTDGQIGNAVEVAETVRGLLSKGHGFVLIQIGKQSAFGELLRKLGVATHVISDHRQLEGLYVEWAQAVWGEGANA
jgi:Mg-chelatase subunit ChlD